jgi:hypothetical protein
MFWNHLIFHLILLIVILSRTISTSNLTKITLSRIIYKPKLLRIKRIKTLFNFLLKLMKFKTIEKNKDMIQKMKKRKMNFKKFLPKIIINLRTLTSIKNLFLHTCKAWNKYSNSKNFWKEKNLPKWLFQRMKFSFINGHLLFLILIAKILTG